MSSAETEDKEVLWRILDIEVNGTLSRPKDSKKHAAVVFLAGSGPTDRDWCSPLLPGNNGTAKLLAGELAKQGYVTLRYDKLGSGPKVKENLPKFAGRVGMQTFKEELSGAVETILAEETVDGENIFALTNSEGAIHAVNYQLTAKSNPFKGLVMTGAPGRAIGQVARTQFLSQFKALPEGELLMKHYDEAIAAFLASRSIVLDPSLPKSMEPFFRSLESPNNLPFSRELWTYDLAQYIPKVIVPTLVVIGKKDIQVDWQLDGKPLENALAQNTRASFYYPENANHVLKHEDLPKEKLTPMYVGTHYNAADAELDAEAAKAIYAWLAKQAA